MNNKNLIKYVILAVLIIILVFIGIKVFTKKPNNNDDIETNEPIVNPSYVEYKRFKFTIPEGMEQTTDDYKIYITDNNNWSVAIDPLLDTEHNIENNVEKTKNLLNESGYVINDGPIARNTNKTNYFYYKVTSNDVKKILAYQYYNSIYAFEVEYESSDENNDDLLIIDAIMDFITSITYDDTPENKYLFHSVEFKY